MRVLVPTLGVVCLVLAGCSQSTREDIAEQTPTHTVESLLAALDADTDIECVPTSVERGTYIRCSPEPQGAYDSTTTVYFDVIGDGTPEESFRELHSAMCSQEEDTYTNSSGEEVTFVPYESNKTLLFIVGSNWYSSRVMKHLDADRLAMTSGGVVITGAQLCESLTVIPAVSES